MALTENGGLSAADVAAVTGNGNNGFGWGDGSFWLLILFLFAFTGNGWGNGFGGNGGMMSGVNADIQRGFDQQAVMSGINGLNNSLANAEVSRCNSQANILQSLNNISSSLQQCCCDNRAGIADLKYTVATEACADRSAVSDALRDVIASNNAGIQRILDQMCQDKIDAKDEIIANLRTQLNMANLTASQTAQTARILSDNAAQTVALEQYLNPTPVPAYMVQNPNCCNNFNYGCGTC